MDTISKDNSNLLLLNAFYKSIGDKKPAAAAAFFADKFDWYIPKSDLLPWTGQLTTKQEIIKALELLFDAHIDGEDQMEIDHIFIDGNQAAVFGKASRVVKTTGKKFTTQFCQRFIFSDEKKIINFLMLEDTPQIEKAF